LETQLLLLTMVVGRTWVGSEESKIKPLRV